MSLDVLGIDASRATVAHRTGTEWYSWEIIRAIAALQDRPTLRLYYRDRSPGLDGTDVEEVHVDRLRLWTHLGLAGELRRKQVDALFVPAHVIPRNHPRATVVTIHDLGFRHEREAHTRRRLIDLELTTRWNAWRATRIIVPSTATSRDLERDYGVDPGRIDVVPHGLDHSRFRPLSPDRLQATLAELEIKQPYILFVSTIQPRKNLSRLIAAFESPSLSRFKLVVAGAAGWKSAGVIDRMDMSARREDIRWLGYVNDEQLPPLYTGAAAFVMPSLYEGFGMGVLEAMACGCPTIVSSTSSLPEVAGDAAIAVDPLDVRSIRDGILRAVASENAPELKARGLAHAATFTWRHTAQETLQSIQRAYAETCGNR